MNDALLPNDAARSRRPMRFLAFGVAVALDKNGVILASTRTAKFGDLFKVVYDQSTLKQTMTIVSPVTFTGQFSTVVCDATAEVDVGFVTSE